MQNGRNGVIEITAAAFMGGQGAKAHGIAYCDDGTTPTLKATNSGSNQAPDVVYQNTGIGWWNESKTAETLRTPCGGDSSKANLAVYSIERKRIVRRLTPLECNRLQGFPDGWGCVSEITDLTDEEHAFWKTVRNTHAAINGKKQADYTKAQIIKWMNALHTDSAEYKMWGNGIALPCARDVIRRIAEAVQKEEA